MWREVLLAHYKIKEHVMGHPTIYPTGVTVYDPERSWNGFTIFQAQEVGAVLGYERP